MNLFSLIRRRAVLSFSLIVYIASWSLGLALYRILQITGSPARVTEASPLALLLLFLAGGLSSLAGIGMTLAAGGKQGLKELFGRLPRWRTGLNWYAVAILTTFVAATAVLLFLATTLSPDFQPLLFKGQNLATVVVFALFFGLSIGIMEEFGWTGFALPRLLELYPAFSAALRLGLIWSVWHALLVLWIWPAIPSTDPLLQVVGGLVWMAALVPYRILMSWVYINTNSSLLIAILMHAFYDGSLAILVPPALSPFQVLLFYAGMNVILWVFVGAVVVAFGAKTMARSKVEHKLQPLIEKG